MCTTPRAAVLLMLTLLICAPYARAQSEEAAKPPLRTLAVIGYDLKWIDDPKERGEFGDIMTALVTDRLSAVDDLVIVERKRIDEIMKELELNLTGLVDADQRVKVGRLLGARFLLTGSDFKLGEEIYVQTTVTDVETSQIKGIIEKFPRTTSNADIVTRSADALVIKLPKIIVALAPAQKPGPTAAEIIKDRLAGRRNQWLIASNEEHKGPPIIDPAVQTELENLLASAGQACNALPKPAALDVLAGKKKFADLDADKTCSFYIQAEGFSEFGKRLNADLVSCVGRVEMKIIDARTGNTLAAGDAEGRATDLGEQLAAKQALKRATRQLLLQLVGKLPEPREPAADADVSE